MGFLDALSGIFSSGGGGGGYAGPNPWLMALGGLASRFRATPNPGASRGDIERANRINLLTGLLGAGASAYGAYSDNHGKQQALQGLFDIYKQGGMQQQGPMPDGSAMPKLGLAESIFAWGAQNPGLSDQAMQLGLQASQQDIANKRYDQERAFQQQQFQQRQSEFDRQLAETSRMHNASIAQQQAQLGLGYAQMNAANARAGVAAQNAQQNALLGMVKDHPDLVQSVMRGQYTVQSPQAPAAGTPIVPGVSSPEVLDGARPISVLEEVGRRAQAQNEIKRGDTAFNALTKSDEFKKLNDSYPNLEVMRQAVADPSKVSDLAAVTASQKAWRPGEAIMSDDMRNVLSTVGIGPQAWGTIKSIYGGDTTAVLDPDTKRKLLQFSVAMVAEREKQYNNLYNAYKTQYGDRFQNPWARPPASTFIEGLGSSEDPMQAAKRRAFETYQANQARLSQ